MKTNARKPIARKRKHENILHGRRITKQYLQGARHMKTNRKEETTRKQLAKKKQYKNILQSKRNSKTDHKADTRKQTKDICCEE